MDAPRLLDRQLLDCFERRLRAEGALIVDGWAPGLNDREIDALLQPLGIDLPEEARVWWRWHNGTSVDHRSPAAEISPFRALRSLEQVADFYAFERDTLVQLEGADGRLRPVSEQPEIYFDCTVSRDEPVPVISSPDSSGPHRVVLPSIGELVRAWIDLLDRGIWATNPDGTWAIEPNRVLPADVLNLGIY